MTFHVNCEINWILQISFLTRGGFGQCKDLYILVRQKMQPVIKKHHNQSCNSVINQILPRAKRWEIQRGHIFWICFLKKCQQNILNFRTLKYTIAEASLKILLSYIFSSPLFNITLLQYIFWALHTDYRIQLHWTLNEWPLFLHTDFHS